MAFKNCLWCNDRFEYIIPASFCSPRCDLESEQNTDRILQERARDARQQAAAAAEEYERKYAQYEQELDEWNNLSEEGKAALSAELETKQLKFFSALFGVVIGMLVFVLSMVLYGSITNSSENILLVWAPEKIALFALPLIAAVTFAFPHFRVLRVVTGRITRPLIHWAVAAPLVIGVVYIIFLYFVPEEKYFGIVAKAIAVFGLFWFAGEELLGKLHKTATAPTAPSKP